MARVTVEDCIEKVENRFDLVLLAAQRARQLSSGMVTELSRDDDKNPVIALREIADEAISPDELKKVLINNTQRFVQADNPFGKDDDDEESLLKELEKEMELSSDSTDEEADFSEETTAESFDDDFAKALEALADQLPDDLEDSADIKFDE